MSTIPKHISKQEITMSPGHFLHTLFFLNTTYFVFTAWNDCVHLVISWLWSFLIRTGLQQIEASWQQLLICRVFCKYQAQTLHWCITAENFVHNLCVYNGRPPNNAFCYCWTEVDGKLWGIEIATFLYRWLQNLFLANIADIALI